MTLAAVLCCAMTTVVFTACSSNEDNPTFPSIDVNNGVVINLGSIVIKPYLQFGASLADVEKYMKENYADWTDNNPNALNEYQQQGGSTWKKTYTKDNMTIKYLFGNASGGSLLLVSYGFNSPISLPAVKAELERNGFTYEGVLKFDDYDADVCNLFLSADKTIETQLSYWAKDGGSWSISFQNLDEYDLQFLVPEDVNKGVVISLSDIVIKPYLQFGASLADVEKYMKENYPDYKAEDTEALQSYTWENVTHYYRLYVNGNRSVIFYFANADGSNFNNVAYCYSFPMSLEPAMAELERNGFVYKGELKFDDPSAADVDHMYLSADESIEVQLCSWEKDGGKWAISFQPLDKNDLNHVEWDPKYNVFPYTHEGQTLYYRLKTDALTNQTYAICSYPTLTPTTVETLWDGYEKPVGDVEIPGTVAYDGQSYPVLDVGRCAFAYCDGITSVTIPEGVFKLGNAAFYNCLGLQTITLPDGLTVIDDNAFDFCASLHSITLPGSLATLGNSAFGYCESLQQITIPGSVSTIGEYAFNNCHSLQNVTLGEGVETIGQCAFRECGSLTDINYPSSLRVIGDYAFQYDSALASPVLLPEGFTTLGQVAFGDCVSLRYASLPSTLNSLGDWAFAVCELDTLIVASSEPPALPENTFSSYNTVLYVPVGSAEAYRQHPVWSLFTNIVEGTATSH